MHTKKGRTITLTVKVIHNLREASLVANLVHNLSDRVWRNISISNCFETQQNSILTEDDTD